MAVILAVIVAVFLAAVGLFLRRWLKREPAGWSAGPVIDARNSSGGLKVSPDGSFTFPTAAPGVHYVTRKAPQLSPEATLRLRYRIDAEAGVSFVPTSDSAAPSIGPTLYLQREGDDWSGAGTYDGYRWWATFASPMPIVTGEHEIVVPLSGPWTSVEGHSGPEVFEEAIRHAGRFGFTFGGGTGFGHGVYATGPARFTLLEMNVCVNSPSTT
jgi:hypothetical protein